jgi:signal transduction histidine kinase
MDQSGELPEATGPSGILNRRYLAMFGLVALLVVLNQAFVQPWLFRLMTDAPLINLAGRQRMLSQRLAKAALALEVASGTAERRARRDELAYVLEVWSNSHDALYAKEKARARADHERSGALAAFDDIEPIYRRMHEDAARIVAGDNPTATNANLTRILRDEAEFLPRMEQIVGLYEQEAREHVNRLIWVGWGLTAFVLIALASVGWFILRPASRLIAQQVEELRHARDALETRVLERTAELEHANREIALEIDRRAAAEERQRSLLEQFSHVSRTTTIGEMATGLAHELNQPLGAIANYTEGCLVALDAPEPALPEVRGVLEKVLATTLRAGAVVKRIRRFVTRTPVVHERFEPARLVYEVEEFFRDEAARRGVRYFVDVAPDLPWVNGDPVQLQQVLVNLVLNAFDAVRALQPLEPKIVISARRTPHDGVEFAVIDNGEGIPEDRLPRIFDAFFSTRDQGMGMGLAISRTIIESHHGRIRVESEPGLSTAFRFTLPSADVDNAGTDCPHR